MFVRRAMRWPCGGQCHGALRRRGTQLRARRRGTTRPARGVSTRVAELGLPLYLIAAVFVFEPGVPLYLFT